MFNDDMSTQNIVERILSDANEEAQAIIAEAESKATQIMADASSRAEIFRKETEGQMQEKTESILEKKAAAARLDSAKILLAEKRKVVDAVYTLALGQLVALSKEDCLRLCARLLDAYAETGDELFFAENFKYADEVALLPVVKNKQLIVSNVRLPMDGGMKLVGKVSDKDLSYGAILALDREENQAALAKNLFK